MQDRLNDHERRISKIESENSLFLKRIDKKLDSIRDNINEIKKDVREIREDISVLKFDTKRANADVLLIRESQSDMRDRIVGQGTHIEAIREEQERQKETLGDLINYAESHDNKLESVATKEDLSSIDRKLDEKFDTIIKLLQERKEGNE